MFAAAVYNDLCRVVFEIIVGGELVGNCLAQFRCATGRRVFGESICQSLYCCILNVLWRVKVRFAGSKADHVLACSAQLFGFGGDGKGQRWGQRRSSLRYSVFHIGREAREENHLVQADLWRWVSCFFAGTGC